MTSDHIALSDAVSAVRDCIETLAKLDNVDAITDAISALEDVRGNLWKAECRAEEIASHQTMRDTARDVAWHNGRVA